MRLAGYIALTIITALPALAEPKEMSMTEMHEGFFPLFNGEDLAGWWARGDDGEASFTVENGMIVSTGEEGADWLFTNDEFADFTLRYEFRIQPEGEGNSGVAVRATKDGDPTYQGMEIQIIRPDWEVPYQQCGALYRVVPPAENASKPAGEWNEVEVLCEGERVRTTMNGKVLYDIKTSDYAEEKDWQKPLTDRPVSGYIALQNHGNRVEFRNIRVKEAGLGGF